MEYEELDKLFHKDMSTKRKETNLRTAEERLNQPGTFRLNLQTPNGQLFVATPREMTILQEKILRTERRVSAQSKALPPIAGYALVRNLVLDEVVSSNAIEAINSTRAQVLEALQHETGKALEARRFREFAKLYLGLANSNEDLPKTPQDIRNIYDAIMAGELEETERPDGTHFRARGVNIVRGGTKIVHSGLEPESKIIEAIEAMLALVQNEEMPTLIGATASHYLFEYAHPFYDGNGRTGRYLLALFLKDTLSMPTVLSLSRTIAKNKLDYYRCFSSAEKPLNHGELTFFVYGMMELIRIAQSSIMIWLEETTLLFDKAQEALEKAVENQSLSQGEANVLFVLLQFELFGTTPSVTLDELDEYIDASKQTIRKKMGDLEEKGFLTTTARRPLSVRLSNHAKTTLGIPEHLPQLD